MRSDTNWRNAGPEECRKSKSTVKGNIFLFNLDKVFRMLSEINVYHKNKQVAEKVVSPLREGKIYELVLAVLVS